MKQGEWIDTLWDFHKSLRIIAEPKGSAIRGDTVCIVGEVVQAVNKKGNLIWHCPKYCVKDFKADIPKPLLKDDVIHYYGKDEFGRKCSHKNKPLLVRLEKIERKIESTFLAEQKPHRHVDIWLKTWRKEERRG